MGMPPFNSMGGAIFTGDRIALGRGRSLELLTEEMIWTGPSPTTLSPTSSVSMASSSDPLDRSLPDSPEPLLLDELELLEADDELFRPLLVSGISGGIPGAATAVTRTLPTLEMWREEEEEVEVEEEEEEEEALGGGCALVSGGRGLLRGLLAV